VIGRSGPVRSAALTRPIPLGKLRPGKNPRGRPPYKVDDLLTSFANTPLLQNIVVRRIAGPRDEYEVIAGHRRYEAAKRLGWSHIEAKVVEVSDEITEAYALEENLRRKALPDEPTALARLLEIYERQGATRRGGDRRSARFKESNGQAGRLSAVARIAKTTGQSETLPRLRAHPAPSWWSRAEKAYLPPPAARCSRGRTQSRDCDVSWRTVMPLIRIRQFASMRLHEGRHADGGPPC
jgi:hypothetical protein